MKPNARFYEEVYWSPSTLKDILGEIEIESEIERER